MISTMCEVMWEYHSKDIPADLEEIAEIVAEGRQDGPDGYADEEIVGVFKLKDGRYLYVSGGCDTTGWDCQSSASGEIRDTLEQIIAECCTEDDRKLLGLSLP